MNGKSATPDSTKNDEALATNGTLSAQKPSKSAAEANLDSEGDGDKESEGASKAKGESARKEEADVQAPASPPKSATPKPATNDDSMDIDTPTDRPDVTSSAEHVESTQDTSVISDSAIVTSPQEPSQAADVSKLEIQSPLEASQRDISMPDRVASPAKVGREREEEDDDGEDEPLAKRAKREPDEQKVGTPNEKAGDTIGVASGLSPAPADLAEDYVDDVPDDQAITLFHCREIRKELARVKKTKNGMNFRTSVEKLWPGIWDNYRSLIDKPVDLALFEAKFRDNQYATFGEFKADLRLLYDNSLKFNGTGNIVTIAASRVRHDLFNKISEIAKAQEPVRIEKGKAQPTRHTEPRAATQPRRQSQSQPQAASPKSTKPEPAPSVASTTPVSTTAPAFALPPNGVPQIRRDSTRDDGDRPKRPIHPPKNRDPDYAAQGSRKKKLEPEMKFYSDVLSDLKKAKYWSQNQWFLEPVDPVALNIPTYFSVVKKPMDLKSMTEKLESGEYRSGKEVEKDMKQIVSNSELFNGEGVVTSMARELEQLFKDKLAEKESWMAKNYPPSAPSVANSARTPEPSDQEFDDESDGEAQEDSESIRNVQSRLTEEQGKLDTMLAAKRPDITMVEIQQNVVQMLQRKLVEEKSKASTTTKKPKSQKKSAAKAKPKSNSTHNTGANHKKSASTTNIPSNKNRPTVTKKSQPKKRAISQIHKQVITEGISELDGPTLDKAVDIIKKDTNQRVSFSPFRCVAHATNSCFQEDDDGQLELDIEVLSQDALWRLFELINRAYPNIYETVAKRPEFSNHEHHEPPRPKPAGASSKPKKNKPMNKQEQERNIEKLRELKAQFSRQGSGSQEPVPTDEQLLQAGHSSEEESDSEEE